MSHSVPNEPFSAAITDRVLDALRARGGTAAAFTLAQAAGLTLTELAPTLAYLAEKGLAECHAADWRLPASPKPKRSVPAKRARKGKPCP